MGFRDFATDEAATLIRDLLTRRVESPRTELKSLRRAFDEAVHALDAALAIPPVDVHDADVAALAARLTAAAASETEDAISRVRLEAQARVDALQAELDRHVAAGAARATSLLETAARLEAEEAARSAALADVARLTMQLEIEAAEAAAVRADLARVTEARGTEAAERAAERASAGADLMRMSQQLEDALSETAVLRAGLAAAQRQLEAAAEERRTLAGQRKEQDDDAFRAAGRAALAVDRLRDGIREISAAATPADALTAVASALAADFDRRAVFSVSGNRLEGRYQAGFDVTSDISKVVVPLTMDSLLAQAVSSNRVESLSGSGLAGSPVPFGGSPACVLALPVSVHGQVVAVVYADDAGGRPGDTASIEQSTTIADLLRHYAAVRLEVLATEQRSVRELREYAKLLVDEVDQLYRADVETGGEGEWLRTRLQENLQCVREIYARRAALEGPAAAGLLEEQIAACVRANGTTPFGRDLAAALATGTGAVPSSHHAAQAS